MDEGAYTGVLPPASSVRGAVIAWQLVLRWQRLIVCAHMDIPDKGCRWIGIAVWVVVWHLSGTVAGRAEDVRLESVGVLGGIPANHASGGFNKVQVFANWNLPWALDLGKGWQLQTRADLLVGWLGNEVKNAAILSVGPSVVLYWRRAPVLLEAGASPTVLSGNDFGSRNFGTDVQFTSHGGLNLNIARNWRLGYRFEHMSNAGLSARNGGLNLHLFSLSYLF